VANTSPGSDDFQAVDAEGGAVGSVRHALVANAGEPDRVSGAVAIESRACLNRAVRRAMARDKVKRKVVELTEVPRRPTAGLSRVAELVLDGAPDPRRD
jgi:hypothetical protein